jgi:hypothetical protein
MIFEHLVGHIEDERLGQHRNGVSSHDLVRAWSSPLSEI